MDGARPTTDRAGRGAGGGNDRTETGEGSGGGLRQRLKRRLRGFVEGLSPIDRRVFLLRYADRLHPIDIALVLGLPEHAVSSILRRIDIEAKTVLHEERPLAVGAASA